MLLLPLSSAVGISMSAFCVLSLLLLLPLQGRVGAVAACR
jgi:hypothetical protein